MLYIFLQPTDMLNCMLILVNQLLNTKKPIANENLGCNFATDNKSALVLI